MIDFIHHIKNNSNFATNCIMKKIFQTILLSFIFIQLGFSQKTKIELDIDHHRGDTVLVSFEILNRYPVLDTIVSHDGHFVYEADSVLAPGVYMLVFPPNNDFITVLLNGDENDIKIHFQI